MAEISKAIGQPNGMQAVNLRVAELYLQQFGNLAKTNNTMIVPSNLTDISTMVASALTVMKGTEQGFGAGSTKPIA